MMKPTRAIVREPGNNYTKCISQHPQRHTIDVALAREQHSTYCRTLEDLGVEVIKLPTDNDHPDSCFVEDNAVVFGQKALVCRMAKESRRGEEIGVESILDQYLKTRKASSPATIEGGDVIHIDRRLISGVTRRTNHLGVRQMAEWLDVKVDTIMDEFIVHLKSYVNYLGKGKVISTTRYARHPSLAGYEVIVVSDQDWYSTNCLVFGDTVIMSTGFPNTESLVKDAGFDVIPLEMTEFPKCEGALTCLSILF